ncbi:death domain-containing protein CRADD-like isoform X2 [Pomacea canaliculata]|uniref:death domain-containing protein CRADD-like isoform X2 n=1 Tax=Pomacea canaliculata TaxID=400727 RepID=UPI000D72C0EA|nr:death domain-containing protein CRADD-like isoform X2 [Pomacea canaliculata]
MKWIIRGKKLTYAGLLVWREIVLRRSDLYMIVVPFTNESRMPVKKGQLRPRDHCQIQRNFDVLCKDLEPDDIIDYLISNLVFNLDDREAIKAEKLRRDRVGKCVELILRAGEDAFKVFLDALEENGYKHLAEKIRETDIEVEVPADPFAWIEQLPENTKNQCITDQIASKLSGAMGAGWEHVFLNLGLTQVNIEQIKMSNPYSATTQIANLFIKWKQREARNGTLIRVLEALKRVNNQCSIEWETVKKMALSVSS